MSFIVFILLGLAVCAFTYALFNRRPSAVMVNLGVSVTGAVMAGLLFNYVAATTGATVLSITDALVAAVAGAVVLLAAYHATLRWTR